MRKSITYTEPLLDIHWNFPFLGDYDYKTAIGHGLQPNKEGHWPSRIGSGPLEGQYVKAMNHPSLMDALLIDMRDEGLMPYMEDNRLHTLPFEELIRRIGKKNAKIWK